MRLGDLAVTPLGRLAKAGVVEAIEDLRRIATARAAEVLARLLFDNIDEYNSRRAAWNLATFFSRTDILQRLRKIALSQLPAGLGESWRWVWQPFEDDTGSPLIRIVGRMAELISANSESEMEIVSSSTETMDKRLAVALLINNHEEFDSSDLKFPFFSKTEDIFQLETWKDEILSRLSSARDRIIVNMCPLELMDLIGIILVGNRNNLLRKYSEQFINVRHPLSYIDAIIIVITQSSFIIYILLWFIVNSFTSFEFYGRDVVIPDFIDLLGIDRRWYLLFYAAFVVVYTASTAVSYYINDDYKFPVAVSAVFSAGTFFGIIVCPFLTIFIIITLGINVSRVWEAAFCVSAFVFFLATVCSLEITYSWYVYITEGSRWYVAAGAVCFIAMLSALHWGMILRALKQENPFRGRLELGPDRGKPPKLRATLSSSLRAALSSRERPPPPAAVEK